MENRETPPQKPNEASVRRFRARVRQMNENAVDVTKQLGLPKEAENTVLGALYGQKRSAEASEEGSPHMTTRSKEAKSEQEAGS